MIFIIAAFVSAALAFSLIPAVVGLLVSRTYCLLKRRSK